jgi:hypothetical protein
MALRCWERGDLRQYFCARGFRLLLNVCLAAAALMGRCFRRYFGSFVRQVSWHFREARFAA